MNLNNIRKEYTLGALDISNLPADPFELFRNWLNEAIAGNVPEPTAMVLSTIDPDGYPQSRVVLLKSAENGAFTFFTNYSSRKGRSIEMLPKVSLLFFWPELQRQVRISGDAHKTGREETELYFATRPYGSKIGAWASDQSSEVPSRSFLEARFAEISESFRGKEIPAPDHWGGYKVVPVLFEFWQGRESRLHDRIIFETEGKIWKIKRLAP
jgi:pyridoxamine 5'-phosphate oxidase